MAGTVTSITSDQPTYCNIMFAPDDGMTPEQDPGCMALSARMVEKIEDDGVREVPPTDPAGYMGVPKSVLDPLAEKG